LMNWSNKEVLHSATYHTYNGMLTTTMMKNKCRWEETKKKDRVPSLFEKQY